MSMAGMESLTDVLSQLESSAKTGYAFYARADGALMLDAYIKRLQDHRDTLGKTLAEKADADEEVDKLTEALAELAEIARNVKKEEEKEMDEIITRLEKAALDLVRAYGCISAEVKIETHRGEGYARVVVDDAVYQLNVERLDK